MLENEWRRTSHLRTPDLGEGYLPSFYPNTTDASKAQPIVIRAGDDIRSLDFFLHPASLVSVSGRVLMGFPTTANTAVGVYLNPRGSGVVPDMMNLSGSTETPKQAPFESTVFRSAPILWARAIVIVIWVCGCIPVKILTSEISTWKE